jgi:DNA-binding MarR family transcriptional regulator
MAHAQITRRINSALAARHQLSLESYDILLALEDAAAGCVRLKDLAERTVFSPSGLSRHVDRLESIGLVTREAHPTDRRSTVCRITKKGKEARERAWTDYRALLQEHFGSLLSCEDAQGVRTGLRKVIHGDFPDFV